MKLKGSPVQSTESAERVIVQFEQCLFISAPVTGNHKLSPRIASTDPQQCTITGREGGSPDGEEPTNESACQDAVSHGGGESGGQRISLSLSSCVAFSVFHVSLYTGQPVQQ